MHQDTRRLTVASEHLRAALEEITVAQGQSERSVAHAASGRARSHLDLVLRRLKDERGRMDDRDLGARVELAYTAARAAWRGVHDAMNDWPSAHIQVLGRTVSAPASRRPWKPSMPPAAR